MLFVFFAAAQGGGGPAPLHAPLHARVRAAVQPVLDEMALRWNMSFQFGYVVRPRPFTRAPWHAWSDPAT